MRPIDIVKRAASRLTPQQLYLSRIAIAHADDVIATIELDDFMKLRKAARDRTLALNALKYFNISYYMPVHVKRALLLNLNGNRPKAVLDIGSGFGYFPYVVNFFGGTATAIDVPGHKLFDDVTDFLGIDKTHHFVTPFEKLPDFPQKFNLVTASQVAFNRHSGEKAWGSEEWRFFLDDLRYNVLNEGGEAYFELNYDFRLGNWYSQEVIDLFKSYSAFIRAGTVHIKW